jgi:hypothetical protein
MISFNTKALIATLTATISCGISAHIYLPKNVTIDQVSAQSASKNAIVAWDLHGVVLERDGTSKFKSIVKGAPGGLLSILSLGFAKVTGAKTKASKANDEIKKLSKTVDLSGEAYAHIFKKHGLTGLSKTALDASQAYKPMPGMHAVIQEISTNGHTQRFASNIGFESLDAMKKKLKTKYKSTVLELIQPGKVVDYRKFGPANVKTIAVDPVTVASVGKPDPLFYDEFNACYNTDGSKTVIFIDDKPSNIAQANKKGWVGIHFNKKSKNAVQQLRDDFKKLGIL